MKLKDFLFSYRLIILFNFDEKKIFKALKKIIGYPYKYLLEIIRNFFHINKKNLDNENFNNLKKKSLDEIFIFFNSDKGSQVIWGGKNIKGHNYAKHYEKYFAKFKSKKNLKILEIGSLIGASAASFLNYFDDAHIFCCDVNPFQIKYNSNKISKLYINTRSKKILKESSNHFNFNFDIIIDDGSHNKKDQILTLNSFLSKLNKGGIYVIEDTYEYLRIPELNDDNLNYGVNDFIYSVFYNGDHFSKYLDTIEKKNIQLMMNSINFEKGNFTFKGKNFSEIIFIEKK